MNAPKRLSGRRPNAMTHLSDFLDLYRLLRGGGNTVWFSARTAMNILRNVR